MNSLFGNLFGSPNTSTAAGTTGLTAASQLQQETLEQKLKLYEKIAAQKEMEEAQRARMEMRYGLGMQAANALSPKYTMTAAQMQAWQKAQLEVQEAKAAEERRRAKEELEMPHNACSVSVAVDLWIVQYGDGWVYIGDIPETVGSGEMQWRELGKRLAGVNRMEVRNNHWRIVT
jgi:hypothetical protein